MSDIETISKFCEHIIDADIVDMGDDGDGYIAYDIYVCTLCGKEWSLNQYSKEFNLEGDN